MSLPSDDELDRLRIAGDEDADRFVDGLTARRAETVSTGQCVTSRARLPA